MSQSMTTQELEELLKIKLAQIEKIRTRMKELEEKIWANPINA